MRKKLRQKKEKEEEEREGEGGRGGEKEREREGEGEGGERGTLKVKESTPVKLREFVSATEPVVYKKP